MIRCTRCGGELRERSIQSTVHTGIAATNWALWPSGRVSCKAGGPHQPDQTTTLSDDDLRKLLDG